MKTKKKSRSIGGDDAFLSSSMLVDSDWWDGDASALAAEFIASATSAEGVGEAARDEWAVEELGGPFRVFSVRFVAELPVVRS